VGFFGHPAIRTGDGRTGNKFLVGPSLVPTRTGNFGFWMSHQILLLVELVSGLECIARLLHWAAAGTLPEVFPTNRTKPGTIFGTERIFRKVGQDEFPNPGKQIDLPVIPILFVLRVCFSPLLSVQKMGVFPDSPPCAEYLKTTDTNLIQRIINPGKNIHFRPVPTDRALNLEGLPPEGPVIECIGGKDDREGIFGSPTLVGDPVYLEFEFKNS
jgi:hypothetical protein